MKSNSGNLHDIVVIGGGPAGAAAALTAAHLNRSTLLVEKHTAAGREHPAAWIGPAGIELLTAIGISSRGIHACEFRGIRLFSADFRKTAAVEDEDFAGWIVEPAALCDELWRLARAGGVTILHGTTPCAIEDGENCYSLRLSDDQRIAARILIVADGADSPTSRMLPLSPAPARAAHTLFASFDSAAGTPGLSFVLGSGGLLGTVLIHPRQTQVLLELNDGTAHRDDVFRDFCDRAANIGLIPHTPPSRQGCIPSVAGLALDRESHTGKGCLIVGRAGGFAAACSNESLFPAMKSGCIAAEVANRALSSQVPQDVLATFSAEWRNALADYLRMPNTDLNLLLPLVFSNPQMSRRVARAFLLGQQF